MAIIEMTRAEFEKKYGQKPLNDSVAPINSGPTPRPVSGDRTATPLLTNEGGGFGTALKDVSVGVGKELIESSRGVAQTLQSIGKGALGLFGANTEKMGIKELEDKQIDEQLKAKSRGEQVGKVLGFATELGAGFTKAKPAITQILKARGQQKAIRAATPEVKAFSSRQYQEALRRGQIKPSSLLKPEKYILPEAEKATAIKYRQLLTSKNPVKNSQRVLNEISNQDKAVGRFLEKNNSIYNNAELKNHILQRLQDVDDVNVTPERLLKLKETMVDGFIRKLSKNDSVTLWKTRKSFDQSIKKVFSGSPTLQNTIKREFRNAIQDFIATKTPNKTYSNAMKEMSSLYRIYDNTVLQAAREKGMTGIRILMRRHPVATKITGGYVGYEAAKSIGILPGE